MYYDSALLKKNSVCKELRQNIGQLAYMMTIPFCNMTLPTNCKVCIFCIITELLKCLGCRLYLLSWYGTSIDQVAL